MSISIKNILNELLLLFIIIIMIEIIRRKKYPTYDPVLFLWISMSIYTIFYCGIAIKYRKEIRDRNLFSIDPKKKYDMIFMKEYIIDSFSVLGNNVDKRYLDPNSIVYLGEGVNIILSVLLIFFVFFTKSIQSIKYILSGQIILTILYFLTFTPYEFAKISELLPLIIFLPYGLIPMIILLRNKYY